MTKKRRDFEAKFTTKLQAWLRHNAASINERMNVGPIEVKVSYDKRFNLKQNIKVHQLKFLMAIRNRKTIVYKISDMDRMRKPWDLDCYTNSAPYFVIMWYRGGNKVFYIIDPIKIEIAMKNGVKSLLEQDAEDMALYIGHLRGKTK